ncbi:MAG: BrnT family toxin [Alphaproteobacteria bacterium]|nr:BrnT family toxin [Alphaproteobacteria bacterium]
MRWIWDADKSRSNKRKHGLSFGTAQLVFDDPLALSRADPSYEEERWQTIGMIGGVLVFVVHTSPRLDTETGDGIGRIISARKATPHERKAYEEGQFT